MADVRSYSVYIIDDDPEYHEMYRRYLEGFPEWTFRIIFQSDPDFDPAETARHKPELIFLDYVLGGRTGLEILRKIRIHNQDSSVIVFTGQGDERVAAEIIKAGADDYVPKSDLTPDVLRLSVARALDRFRLRQERKQAEALQGERDRFNVLRAGIWRLAADPGLDENALIQGILNLAGPALDVSRICYNTYEDKDLICRMEWCDLGVKPSINSKGPAFLVNHYLDSDFTVLDHAKALELIPSPLRGAMDRVLGLFERQFNIETIATVPLRINGLLEGVITLDICHDKVIKPPWTDERRKAAVEISQIISQVLARKRAESARLKAEAEVTEQNRFNALRADIWKIAADKTLDQKALIQRLLDTVGPGLALSRAGFHEKDGNTGDFVYAIEWKAAGLEPGLGTRMPSSVWKRMPIAEYLTQDFPEMPAPVRLILKAFLNHLGIKAQLVVPYLSGNEVVGGFGFIQHDYVRRWNPQEIDILMEVVKIVTVRIGQLTAEKEKESLREQLIAAQKMEAIGQLAGGVAHDFNNILAGISGYADLLKARFTDSGEIRKYTGRILDASRMASGLTGQLLAFARMGKYNPLPVDLHGLIKGLEQELNNLFGGKIRLILALRAEPSETVGDPEQLRNAFMQVCVNAAEAMAAQGGEFTIRTRNTVLDEEFSRQHAYKVTPGEYVLVSFSDTGPGMEESVRTHVFEPFFTTKTTGQGSGLGLSSVYGTVKNHEGYIEVESDRGKGSTFILYLPAHRRGQAQVPAPEPGPGPDRARVLFVDDEQMLRDIGRDMLAEMGCSVTLVRDGMEAVEFYRENPGAVDLVILDLVMPGKSGTETLSDILKTNPKARVIAMTGHMQHPQVKEMINQGVKGLLLKPFRFSDFSREVNRVLSA